MGKLIPFFLGILSITLVDFFFQKFEAETLFSEEATEEHNVIKKVLLQKEEATDLVFEHQEICSYFPTSSSTASYLWQKHLPRIFNASHNPDIPELLTEENEAKLHSLLENILPPSRMRRAIRHMPTFHHATVKNVMEILQKRIQDPEKNPPLRIAVFGGSVTIGRGCHGKGMSNLKCAWPRRLELLINQFLGVDAVQVYNLGVGGTGSGTGERMVKYWMYPSGLIENGPDVIINSYSTNDSLPAWNLPETADFVMEVMDSVRTKLQSFIRSALQSRPCTVPPLVVHVDDYLGPEQDSLLGELSYNTAMTQLAKWYDTVAISYADVVRDIVYKDTSDKTFFNAWDVHFSHWAHQTIAWSVGFGSLELLLNYCDDEYYARKKLLSSNSSVARAVTPDEMNSAKDDKHTNSKKLVLPPPLTRDLILKNATAEFNAALNGAYQSDIGIDCISSNQDGSLVDQNPCTIAWIASPGGYNAGGINGFMRKYSIVNDGWQVEDNMGDGWSMKVGWIATGPTSSFTLRFDNVAKDIQAVTIFYIKSYGEKWEGSRAKFTVSSGKEEDSKTILSEMELQGIHNTTHSLTGSDQLILSDTIPKGGTMTLQVEMISGTTFKILGMMICKY
mmetsp:Transcript_1452/g.2609  ORF Transcript_1452/g.2609 Transcript_1452/m.2609 type:complete len:619 (+) Transcript_1452:204-2060(+)